VESGELKLSRRTTAVKGWIEAMPGAVGEAFANVPTREIKRLVARSYELVCAKLTGKQKAELARLAAARD
jgi:predicted DNA-binding protein (MmcQ/YjbR family)